MRRLKIAIVATLCAVAVAPAVADAHVYPEKRNPGKGATVGNGLNAVTMTLTGSVISGKIKVKSKQTGNVVGSGGLVKANKLKAKITRNRLRDGGYKVSAKLTAADGHTQKITYGFKVR